MDIILQIIEYTFYVVFAGGVIYGMIFYKDYAKHKKDKNEIANLEAKIITLKMALKVKIKVKVNSFRSQFSKIIQKGNPVDEAINKLAAIQYDRSADFQQHFDISKQINTLINTDRQFDIKAQLEVQPIPQQSSIKVLEEFMGPDYKNELSIIRIIKEIADTKAKLCKKIEFYNEEYHGQKKRPPLSKPEVLEFSALSDINLIFKDSDLILKEMQKKHSEIQFKNLAA